MTEYFPIILIEKNNCMSYMYHLMLVHLYDVGDF